MAKRKLSDVAEENLVMCYNDNESVTEIAYKYGISHSTVYDILRRHGIIPSRKNVPDHEEVITSDNAFRDADSNNSDFHDPVQLRKPYEPPKLEECKISKPKFRISNFQGNCVMHCPKNRMAETFTKRLEKFGYKWNNGDDYKYTNWNVFGNKTCYDFNAGKFGDLVYYKNKKYKILEYADFDWSDSDIDLKLNDFAEAVHENAVNHGWWEEDRELPEILCLIHSEVSEVLEEYRNGKPDLYYGKDGKPEGIASELADIIIRTLDYCAKAGIDIENILKIKHEFNKTRPYRHGGKKC